MSALGDSTSSNQPNPYQPTPSGHQPPGQPLWPGAHELPTLPSQPVPYHQFLQSPRHRWWKPLALIGLIVVSYFATSLVTTGAAIAVDVAMGRTSLESVTTITMTPMLLLGTNLGLALMIPASWLWVWVLYRQKPGYLSSVTGRFRWGWFGRCALVLVPLYVLYVAVSLFLAGVPEMVLQPDALAFLAIVVLTTPLQAAGEEYAVRGALTRAVGAYIPARVVGFFAASVVSAVIFLVGHPNLTPGRIGVLLTIALGFSLLVWRSGGLEAAVLGHVLNNVLLLAPTALWGDMTGALLGESGEVGLVDWGFSVALMLLSWGGIELLMKIRPVDHTGPSPTR